jgi:hypothetical protein
MGITLSHLLGGTFSFVIFPGKDSWIISNGRRLTGNDRLIRVASENPIYYFQLCKPPHSVIVERSEHEFLQIANWFQWKLRDHLHDYISEQVGVTKAKSIIPTIYDFDQVHISVQPQASGGYGSHKDTSFSLSDDHPGMSTLYIYICPVGILL